MKTLHEIKNNYGELTTDVNKYIASKIAESNSNQDFKKVKIYGELGDSVSNSGIVNILNRLLEMETPMKVNRDQSKNIQIKVTAGAIKQNYLSVTAAQNAGLIDHGVEYKFLLPDGTSFTSDIIQNRLRERGKVADFYKNFNINPDDDIEISRIDNTTFTISKITS